MEFEIRPGVITDESCTYRRYSAQDDVVTTFCFKITVIPSKTLIEKNAARREEMEKGASAAITCTLIPVYRSADDDDDDVEWFVPGGGRIVQGISADEKGSLVRIAFRHEGGRASPSSGDEIEITIRSKLSEPEVHVFRLNGEFWCDVSDES